MNKQTLKKRIHFIKGTELNLISKINKKNRRGDNSPIENVDYEDIEFDDFFSFQKELDELEAANKLFNDYKISPEVKEENINNNNKVDNFIVLEEEEEFIFPIIMEELSE